MSFLLPPDRQEFHGSGTSKIPYYVEKLMRSTNGYASVIATTADGAHSILIARQKSEVLLVLFSRLKNDDLDSKRKVLSFFQDRGMAPSNESLSDPDSVNGGVWRLEFPFTQDRKAIALLTMAAFRDLFGVTDSAGLTFSTTGI
jgi:hypothetical protein